MTRLFLALAASVTLALPAHADSRTQLQNLLKHDIHAYAQGVELDTLSNRQLSRLYSVIHGFGSESEKRRHVHSILGNSVLTLFGIKVPR